MTKRLQTYLVEVEETARFLHVVLAYDRSEAREKALADHKKGAPVGHVSGTRVSKIVCSGVPPRGSHAP